MRLIKGQKKVNALILKGLNKENVGTMLDGADNLITRYTDKVLSAFGFCLCQKHLRGFCAERKTLNRKQTSNGG